MLPSSESTTQSLLPKLVATAVICVEVFITIQRVLFRRLEQDAVKHAHLDPTEIIATPFELRLLTHFATTVFAWTSVTMLLGAVIDSSGARKTKDVSVAALIKSFFVGSIGILAASIPVFLLCVLSGASPFENFPHTVLSAIYMSLFAFGPSFFRPGFFESPYGLIRLLVGGSSPSPPIQDVVPDQAAPKPHGTLLSTLEIIDRWAMFGVFAGNIPSSILRVLDHGTQIQRWPVPIILGSSIGYGVGAFVGMSICLIGRFSRGKLQSALSDENETKQL